MQAVTSTKTVELLKILLQSRKEVDLNIKDNFGRTAFMIAAERGKVDHLKLLLEVREQKQKKGQPVSEEELEKTLEIMLSKDDCLREDDFYRVVNLLWDNYIGDENYKDKLVSRGETDKKLIEIFDKPGSKKLTIAAPQDKNEKGLGDTETNSDLDKNKDWEEVVLQSGPGAVEGEDWEHIPHQSELGAEGAVPTGEIVKSPGAIVNHPETLPDGKGNCVLM
jgi:ankyrin repeat protein